MKIIRMVVIAMLLACNVNAETYFYVSNNTNCIMKVYMGFESYGFVLQPYKQIELVSDDYIGLNTQYGYIGEEIDCNTTVEINADCYYIGETKRSYRTER